MINAVQVLREASREGKLPLLRRILLRSARPNGFNGRHSQCLPIDYRTPLNAEMGTKITKEIVSYIHTAIETIDEEKVQLFPPVLFMDTSFIMDAV